MDRDKQLFIEKLHKHIFEFSDGTYKGVVGHLCGESLRDVMLQKVSCEIERVFPSLEFFVECTIMSIPLSDRRDNRIDHILENSELKREDEILLTISYKTNRADEVRNLGIHLSNN